MGNKAFRGVTTKAHQVDRRLDEAWRTRKPKRSDPVAGDTVKLRGRAQMPMGELLSVDSRQRCRVAWTFPPGPAVCMLSQLEKVKRGEPS